jgi:ribosomal protein L37E
MLILLALLAVVLAALVYRFVTGEDLRRLSRRKLNPLLCRIRGHRRSGRHIHKVGDGYHSRCRTCGLPMEKRDRTADWRISARYPAAADAEPIAAESDAAQAPPAEPNATPIIRRGELAEDAA